MKKILFFIGIITGVSLLFTSCSINEPFEFDDSDAFVAFAVANYSVDEDYVTSPEKGNGQKFKIPVTLASVAGKSGTIGIEVVDGTAKAGVNFNLASGNSLTFSAEKRVQNIEFDIIPIPEFTGDLQFLIRISNGGSVGIGEVDSCWVKIADVDHPLSFILGAYTVTGESLFNGATQWNVTISKDETDLSKVWFSNFVSGGTNALIYGNVNAEKTEIRVPVEQEIITTGAAYLRGFYGNANEEEKPIPEGGYITMKITNDGRTITVDDTFGSDTGAGWYNIFLPPVTYTK